MSTSKVFNNKVDTKALTVDILGTTYVVREVKYDSDPEFKARGITGYCNQEQKEIVVCDLQTHPDFDPKKPGEVRRMDIIRRAILRHEIVHAFLSESGLQSDSFVSTVAWAMNEEMIDWFALQGPKIMRAWEAVRALDEEENDD